MWKLFLFRGSKLRSLFCRFDFRYRPYLLYHSRNDSMSDDLTPRPRADSEPGKIAFRCDEGFEISPVSVFVVWKREKNQRAEKRSILENFFYWPLRNAIICFCIFEFEFQEGISLACLRIVIQSGDWNRLRMDSSRLKFMDLLSRFLQPVQNSRRQHPFSSLSSNTLYLPNDKCIPFSGWRLENLN